MTLRLLWAVLAGRAVTAADTVALPVDLNSQIFRYLDSTGTEEAASGLQPMLSDPMITIDRAVRIIQTERVYPQQPTGILPDERINGQVPFESFVPPSIETLLRQDFQQLFPIHLAVQVRKQP